MEHTDYINRVKHASEHRQEFVKKAGESFDRIALFVFILFVSDLVLIIIAIFSEWGQIEKHAFFALAFLYLCFTGIVQWRKHRKTKSIKVFADVFPEEAAILEQNRKEQEEVKE